MNESCRLNEPGLKPDRLSIIVSARLPDEDKTNHVILQNVAT